MAVQRMDNVGIVFRDLEAAVAFFVDLGLEVEGRGTVEGAQVDRLVGLEKVRSDLVMLRTPGGQRCLELMGFRSPATADAEPEHLPVNAPGLRRLLFLVDDLDATAARLRARGAEPIGETTPLPEAGYVMAYLRGPEGVIVALTEQIGGADGGGAA